MLRGVEKYTLALKKNPEHKTEIMIGDVTIGKNFLLIAGPCSVEDEETMLRIARKLVKLGIKFFRAGAFKPRSSPYSFQGLEEEGLKILGKIKEQTGLKIVTEVISCDVVEKVAEVADILQVGTRNMDNTSLLKKLGQQRKPVLLKRGIAATLDELLMAAEYILLGGNEKVILCERGIRTFDNHCRFTLDIAAIPSLQQITHLPVIVDPSHASGRRELVLPLSRAIMAVKADGLLIEVHEQPEAAYSDEEQTISIDSLKGFISDKDFFDSNKSAIT